MTAQFTVLISAPYLLPFIDRFKPELEGKGCKVIVADVEERLEEEDLLPIIGEIEGVVCGDDRFTDKVLAAAPKLKVISKWGTGIDSIDQEACKKRGIAVRNVPNAFSEPVADSAFAGILAFARRTFEQTEDMRNGSWEKLPGHALNEVTLGVVGLGDCGHAVVRRANAFGMRILGAEIKDVDPVLINDFGVEVVDHDQLFAESDYVTMHTDLNPTSEHMINDRTLGLMKDSAVLINMSRGPVVDEPALIRALENKSIRGAALDVYEFEPLPLDSPLRRLPNVLLASHNANSSPKAWENVHRRAIDNMMAVLKGE